MHIKVKSVLHWVITNKFIVLNGSNNLAVTSAVRELGTGVPLSHFVFLHDVIFSSGPYANVRRTSYANTLEYKKM